MLQATTMDSQKNNNGTAFSATRSNAQERPPTDPCALAESNLEPQIEQFPGREHRLHRPTRMQSLPSHEQHLKRPLEDDSVVAIYVFPEGGRSGRPPGEPIMTTPEQLPELMQRLSSTGGEFVLHAYDSREVEARYQHRRIKELKHEDWNLERLKKGDLSFFEWYYYPLGFRPVMALPLLRPGRTGTGLASFAG